MAKMTKSPMPKSGDGASGKREGPKHRGQERIEWPRTIAPDDHAPGFEILHKKARRVKFNRTIIFYGELTN
jgi:hypothetical protein